MTIAESINFQRRAEKWDGNKYMFECKKLAVKRHMDGPDFMVFTFSDGSIIDMYWS